ncbi:hypothetical protein [Umezawaea sp. Da 62-37]|uniref:hypothetical protein n=1 Tax=Umezawaea sp. Da 62-37 TaxID=3075927 RepID=UPI0028F6EA96|nr:hypothetical protein [Umezawaea sp. Da 62-37]WNV83188.1 hypothetical protein RM788_34075 [Umezawaea sp. Da 62-37]
MPNLNRLIRWARTVCNVLNTLRSLAAAMYRLIITFVLLVTAVATLWSEVMPHLA